MLPATNDPRSGSNDQLVLGRDEGYTVYTVYHYSTIIMVMMTSLISLTISPYTPWGCTVKYTHEGNIDRVKSQYAIF